MNLLAIDVEFIKMAEEVAPIPIEEAPLVSEKTITEKIVTLRPSVSLVEGVNLSPILNSASLPGEAKVRPAEGDFS